MPTQGSSIAATGLLVLTNRLPAVADRGDPQYTPNIPLVYVGKL